MWPGAPPGAGGHILIDAAGNARRRRRQKKEQEAYKHTKGENAHPPPKKNKKNMCAPCSLCACLLPLVHHHHQPTPTQPRPQPIIASVVEDPDYQMTVWAVRRGRHLQNDNAAWRRAVQAGQRYGGGAVAMWSSARGLCLVVDCGQCWWIMDLGVLGLL